MCEPAVREIVCQDSFGSPDADRFGDDGSPRISRPDVAVAIAQAELVRRLFAHLREALVTPICESDLDAAFDDLLEKSWIFQGLRELPKGPVRGDHLRELAGYAGAACAETLRFVAIQTARAFSALNEFCLSQPAQAPEQEPPWDRETLFVPALYLGCPSLPPTVQRALMGRDVAQLALIGLVNARRWSIPLPRVLELCQRFQRHQAFWIEFISGGSKSIDPAALPPIEERTDFAVAFARNSEANDELDLAGKQMDTTGDPVYFLNRRDSSDVGERQG